LPARFRWRKFNDIRRVAERAHIRPLVRIRRYFSAALLALEVLRADLSIGWDQSYFPSSAPRLKTWIRRPAGWTEFVFRFQRRAARRARRARRRGNLRIYNRRVEPLDIGHRIATDVKRSSSFV
jgi:hypothetical protein